MGAALQSVGRSVEAIDALDKGIALNRDSAKAWSTRGTALWNLGRFDEAIPSLDKALELQPDNQDILKIRQRLRKELGR
jgi:Flp pilus assembly protein TadD